MCTPPHPPMMPDCNFKPKPLKIINIQPANDKLNIMNLCIWASEQPELQEACVKNDICLYSPPYKFVYRKFNSILQTGPTCGPVALSMMLNGDIIAEDILKLAKAENYSNNGEIFSCKDMTKLTEKVLRFFDIDNVRTELLNGGLSSVSIINRMLAKSLLLVPYDADFNHAPCLKQGHKAHWALVCGIIITNEPIECPDNVYVLCKHGKSQHLAVWRLDQLESSNRNLFEFSPRREDDGLVYILPEGGIGGVNGLRNQYILIDGL